MRPPKAAGSLPRNKRRSVYKSKLMVCCHLVEAIVCPNKLNRTIGAARQGNANASTLGPAATATYCLPPAMNVMEDALQFFTHWQCCVHPWMRMNVAVRDHGHENDQEQEHEHQQ